MRYVLGTFLILITMNAWASSSQMDLIRKKEPRFNEIIKVALKEGKIDLENGEHWRKKLKAAPWLPTLSFGYDRSLKETNAIAINDNISVTSDSVNVGPEDNNLDQSVFSGDVFRVRAVWSLDETIFHHSTLAVSQEGRELAKASLQFSDYLFKVYSKRRELLVEYLQIRSSRSSKSLKMYEQILLFSDQIDSFTNGVFTNQWWREK